MDTNANTIAEFESLLAHELLSDSARVHAYYFANKANLRTAIYYMRTAIKGAQYRLAKPVGINLTFTAC